jgi:hypothetical protein
MSELTKLLVLAVAFAAFILAAYLQEGGSWRGPHNLRKSLPAKGATIGMQGVRLQFLALCLLAIPRPHNPGTWPDPWSVCPRPSSRTWHPV